MNIQDAKRIAEHLIDVMRPFCERIEIAGSIRRGKQDVKDIKIVAVPRWTEWPQRNHLHDWAVMIGADGERLSDAFPRPIRWAKPNTKKGAPLVLDWPVKEAGKYWRAQIDERIMLDLFLATPGNWGLIFLIRTGSAEFSQGVMTYAKQRTRYHVKDGALRDGSEKALPTGEEREVFRLLGLDWREPHERTGFASITRNGQQVFPPNYGQPYSHRFPATT